MEKRKSNTAAPSVDVPRLVRADSAGIWQLTDNMGNQKTVEVVNDPWGNAQDAHSRLHVRGKCDGYWPVDSSIFDGWEWSRPNDPKLSDRGVRRGTCMAGGKAAAEAGAVTHGAVRCSAWLNQSLREAVLSGVLVFVIGEMLMEQAWMLLW